MRGRRGAVDRCREEKEAGELVQALEKLEGKGQVVIVGGGYIGLECAAALVGWGFEVTMVFPEKHCMPRLFNDELAKWLEDIGIYAMLVHHPSGTEPVQILGIPPKLGRTSGKRGFRRPQVVHSRQGLATTWSTSPSFGRHRPEFGRIRPESPRKRVCTPPHRDQEDVSPQIATCGGGPESRTVPSKGLDGEKDNCRCLCRQSNIGNG